MSTVVAVLPRGTRGEVHSTVIYANTADEQFLSQLVQITQSAASFTPLIAAVVTAHALFGTEMDIEVAQIESGALEALYAVMSQYADSEWGYYPHISRQRGWRLPEVGSTVVFDRIAVWTDEQRWAWRLGTGAPCAS